MLVDENLWTAYYEAQEQLISALLAAAPPAPHIFSTSGPERELLRSSTKESLDDLTSSIKRMEDYATEGHARLLRAQSILTASLAPIEGLPLEIIQSVIEMIVETPRKTSRIDWFRDISRQWRFAIQGMPHLFVDADWRAWSPQKIRSWTSIAKDQPISVSIEADYPVRGSIVPAWDAEPEMCPRWPSFKSRKPFPFIQRCQLAAELAPQLGKLHIKMHSVSPETMENAIIPLLGSPLPRLSELALFSNESHPVALNLGNMPDLVTFHCCGFQVSSLTPSNSITELGMGLNPELFGKLVNFLAEPTSITYLSLYRQPEASPQWPENRPEWNSPGCTLNGLKSIRLHGFQWDNQLALEALLKSLEAPNLARIEISGANNVFPSLVSPGMAGNITSLIVHDVTNLSDVLRYLERSPTLDPADLPSLKILPNLEEIILTPHPYHGNLMRPSALSVDDWEVQMWTRFLVSRKESMRRLVLPERLPDDVRDHLIQAGQLQEVGLSKDFKNRNADLVPLNMLYPYNY
ncbi:hypothetical protein DL93DRAFT_2172470 [Clavulina sp. PMI_390]|nr:hypothetical protein DL93DRAFT_2172470 [Clavulina sp. PMI_390]